MQPVFKNKLLQETFEKHGYVITGLLSNGDIQLLRNIYERYFPNTTSKFYINIFDTNFDARKLVSEKSREILAPLADTLLDNFRFIVSVFTAKKANTHEDFNLHQDITITDESIFPSVSIWCPLQDVDESNGALHLVPGSHRLPSQPRGINIPAQIEKIYPLLKNKYLQTIPMKKGQVIIWDHKLIHGSGTNCSPDDRIASVSLLIPAEAPLLIYYANKSEGNELETEVLQMQDGYYDYYDVSLKPSIEKVSLYRTEKIIPKYFSEEEFEIFASRKQFTK